MKQACILFAILLCSLQPAQAMFRFHKGQHVAAAAHPPQIQHGQGFQRTIALSGYPLPWPHKKRGVNPDDRYNDVAEGSTAFLCAMLSLVCFAALSLTSFSLLAIPALVFATAAIVFGAIGLTRRRQGFAIAGFVLGFIEIIIGFAALVAL